MFAKDHHIKHCYPNTIGTQGHTYIDKGTYTILGSSSTSEEVEAEDRCLPF